MITDFKLVEINHLGSGMIIKPDWDIPRVIVDKINNYEQVKGKKIGQANCDRTPAHVIAGGAYVIKIDCHRKNDAPESNFRMCKVNISILDLTGYVFSTSDSWYNLLDAVFSQHPNVSISVDEEKNIPVPTVRTKMPRRKNTCKSKR